MNEIHQKNSLYVSEDFENERNFLLPLNEPKYIIKIGLHSSFLFQVRPKPGKTMAAAGSLMSDSSGSKERDDTMSESTVAMESGIDKNRERLTKLERIKQKLRDSDSRLSLLVKENSNSLLAGTVKPYGSHSAVAEDDSKEALRVKPYESQSAVAEDDSKEALRVLSYAAFKLQRQLNKKADEIKSLHETIDQLKKSLEEKDMEKSAITVDMNVIRKSLEAHSNQIHRLSLELETKNKAMASLLTETDHHKQEAEELKSKLAASHKDYEWMRKESMSKNEQLEYFEFELLSKNDEIDKLHEEFDRMLRRVVELEVDIELMNSRVSRSSEKKELSDSNHSNSRARTASVEGFDPIAEHKDKRGAFSRLRDLKCQKVEDTEAAGGANLYDSSGDRSIDGSFPTDRSTETTVVISSTASTDFASSPPRIHRRTGRRGTKCAKGSTDQYIGIIDDLRSDLLAMEAKYKQDKYVSTKLIEKLKQENNEYLIKLICMDCKTRRNDDHASSIALFLDESKAEESDSSLFEASVSSAETPLDAKVNLLRAKSLLSSSSKFPNKVEYFKQRIETLEGERLLHQRAIKDLKSRLAETNKIAMSRERADKRRIEDLVFQNEARAVQISEMQRGSRFSRSSNEGQAVSSEYTAGLEAKIQKQAIDIEQLQLENDMKDRVIDALRAQLVDKRVHHYASV